MSDEKKPDRKLIDNARDRRKHATVSEGLLWSILRSGQLCGLKFRREHPIGGFIVDFSCQAKMLVVEVDGGYHDETVAKDIAREEALRELGWDVIRFTDEDVEQDAEAVARAIAKHLSLEYSFFPRKGSGSGMKARVAGTSFSSQRPSFPSKKFPAEPEDV